MRAPLYTVFVRPLLQFFGFVFIVFFIVGELQGWYVGIPPETPMFLYKADHIVSSSRTTKLENSFLLDFNGDVKRGNVLVEVFFEVPASFQGQRKAGKSFRVFHKNFIEGDQIKLKKSIRKGVGRYTVRISYNDTTGIYKLRMPNSNDL